MKIEIISVANLKVFSLSRQQALKPIEAWIRTVRSADWKTPENILETFPSADLLGRGTRRVVFDIGGNKYRMICCYAFMLRRVRLYVCWIGTHSDYSKLCKENKQYTITQF